MADVYNQLCVDSAQPFSSALLAFGLARIADELLKQHAGDDREVSISQHGTHYRIRLTPALDLHQTYDFVRPFKLIETIKNKEDLPTTLPDGRWNYEQEKAKVGRYFELRKTLTPAQRSPGASPDQYPILHELAANQPTADWYGIALVNQMQALTAYNEVVASWLACEQHWDALLAIILRLWGNTPNDVGQAMHDWQTLLKTSKLEATEVITASQSVNPEQGKGSNRAKADALTIGNQSSFWLVEAMKFAGIFEAAVPRTVSGAKDRKTYVLVPKHIILNLHRKVYAKFQENLWPATAVKLDVLASLRYSKLFVEQWQEGQGSALAFTPRPATYIQGLATAFYKDLGSAVATMNLATINLPDWVTALSGKGEAQQLIELYNEHLAIIQSLDETRGGEEALLHSYRDFLSSRDPQLNAFFAFVIDYAAHVMSKLARRQYALPISTTSVEVIIMTNDQQRTKKLKNILDTPGFQNIAEAIRRSTVVPQYQKNQGTRTYDVRYGLGDNLKRKARYPLQFIQELSDFMHLYNQENARVAERYKMQFRKAITKDDIDQVAQLLDDYGDDASAVAYLLIAYGYARDPKEREPKGDTGNISPTTDPTTGSGQDKPLDGNDIPF